LPAGIIERIEPSGQAVVLHENAMPPASVEAPAGIRDDSRREELLLLARRFAQVGDEALRYEGERVGVPGMAVR
jgi:hypothetical protein